MRKLYTLFMAIAISFYANAQTTIDISAIDPAYTTTVSGDLVIDVAATSSAVANPKLSYENPLKGESFTEAEISFDVYNYDTLKVLGALVAVFDTALGRMYFTNGSYLGFNNGQFIDANLINYGIDTDFLGTNAWKHVQLQFTSTGYAVYVDSVLAFADTSTNVTIAGNLTDYNQVIDFLQNADHLVFGTGSFWSDNTRPDGSYYDVQYSYLKNITLTPDFSTVSIEDPLHDFTGEVIREAYFNINGQEVGSDLSRVVPGFYVRKEFFRNGAIRTTKVVKANP